jgi:hypothetical protein
MSGDSVPGGIRAGMAGFGFDQGAGQRGDQHRVVGVQAYVGNADFQGGITLGQARVEVHHARVEQRAGADHVPYRLLVGAGAAEGGGGSGAGPAAPHLVAEAGIGAVASLPERGVGAERQQDRQPRRYPVQRGDPFVGRGDLDMHVAAAGELLVGGQAERLGHLLVAAAGRDLGFDRDW